MGAKKGQRALDTVQNVRRGSSDVLGSPWRGALFRKPGDVGFPAASPGGKGEAWSEAQTKALRVGTKDGVGQTKCGDT